LRETLGEHVAQKGSLQDAERTRFDISHPKAVTQQELQKIEDQVNAEIRANTPVETKIMALDDARAAGAMALFGEKYADEVRVVSMGRTKTGTKKTDAAKPYSIELCGGTHVKRTGDIGLFKIISEGALSAGIRRVEALTGENALRYLNEQEKMLQGLAGLLKTGTQDLPARVEALIDQRKKMEREISDLRKKLAMGGSGGADEIKDIGGIKFIGKILDGFPAKDLRPMADDMKKKLGSGVVALVSTEDGKASIVVGVTDDLTGKFSAVDLVKLGAQALGGSGGGGKPDMAQAGGPNGDAANDAVGAIETKLAG
jgi:alanyl-tRNA synthetase